MPSEQKVEKAIEAAAAANYNKRLEIRGLGLNCWDEVGENGREREREAMRAAILAYERERGVSEAEVEAAARAMAIHDKKDPDQPAWWSSRDGAFGLCWRDQYADRARAALTAAQAVRVKEGGG